MKTFSTAAIVLACLALCPIAGAQQLTTPNGPKSDATVAKIHKLDILLKVLPIAMSREQLGKILTAIERMREQQVSILEKEDADLASIDKDVSDTLDAALTKMVYPSKEVQAKISKTEITMSERRVAQVFVLSENLYASVIKILNPGQFKAMANSYDDRYIDPTVKKGDLKSEQKARFFVRTIFMDPEAYEVLVALEKVAPSEFDPGKGGR